MRRNTLFLLFGILLAAAFAAAGCNDDDPARPAVDTVPPAIPDGLAAWNVNSQSVTLTWSANVSDPDLAGYVVYRSRSRSGPFRPVETDPVTSNSWTDSHTESGRSYFYRVSARDTSRNESALSEIHMIRVPQASRTEGEPNGS